MSSWHWIDEPNLENIIFKGQGLRTAASLKVHFNYRFYVNLIHFNVTNIQGGFGFTEVEALGDKFACCTSEELPLRVWTRSQLGSIGTGSGFARDRTRVQSPRNWRHVRNHREQQSNCNTATKTLSPLGIYHKYCFYSKAMAAWHFSDSPRLSWRCQLLPEAAARQTARWSGNCVMMSLPRRGGWWVWRPQGPKTSVVLLLFCMPHTLMTCSFLMQRFFFPSNHVRILGQNSFQIL